MLVPSHHAPKVGYQRLFPAGLRSPRQEDADRMVWVFRSGPKQGCAALLDVVFVLLAVGGQRRDCRGGLQPNRGSFAGTGIIRGPDLHFDSRIVVAGPGQ